MKWLIRVEHYRYERASFFEGIEEEAKKEAIKRFDYFTDDFGFDYHSETAVPQVTLYPVENPIVINMANHYFERTKRQEEIYKAMQEVREREEYERLQKKFGGK